MEIFANKKVAIVIALVTIVLSSLYGVSKKTPDDSMGNQLDNTPGSELHETPAVSQTPSLDETYELGKRYYEAGEYRSAITELRKVQDSSFYYADAQMLLIEAVNGYRTEILQTAGSYAEREEYTTAINILENALLALPNDLELQRVSDEYRSAYKSVIRAEAIEQSNAYVADGDYENAIKTVNAALDKIGQDEELVAKLSVYTSGYKGILFEDAHNAYLNDGYAAAVSILQTGKSLIGQDGELLQLISNYQDCMPIAVSSLTCTYNHLTDFYEWHYESEMQVQDYVKYSDVISPPKLGTTQITYELNGAYKQLSGTLVWNANHTTYRGWSSYMIEKSTISIYCDEVLVFSGTVSDSKREIPFQLSVSDVNYLRIEMTDFLQSGWGTNNSIAYFAGISNFSIQKNVM